MHLRKDLRIAIIRLGYLGLPLAVVLSKKYPVTHVDIEQPRIAKLKSGRDGTREVESAHLAEASHLSFTADPEQLLSCNVSIAIAPTPGESTPATKSTACPPSGKLPPPPCPKSPTSSMPSTKASVSEARKSLMGDRKCG